MKKILFAFLLCVNGVYGQVKPDSLWMNQKYSMFIHWGLYSELGGVWDGKPVVNGYSEQIQAHAGIFSDWYGAVARRFNPEGWNADSIVALAEQAGIKSIVFTSKHHDGFCMYHSRYTDYNVTDGTPFGRDVMKELSEACQRRNMRFGVYFSLIDWHFPQAYPISSHNADPLIPEHYAYNLKQVEEIMTGYGRISEIWFDMGSLTPEQSRGLYRLVDSLQPGCMVSGRLGNDCSDFSVMGDNEYPEYKMAVPWQTAASFFDETWGYRSWQERGKVRDKADEKVRSLVKVVSRGGNYLLNIGPRGDGGVVDFEREVLLEMGSWLKKYGEGIYGTGVNPFDVAFKWGEVTVKGKSMYLFVDNRNLPEKLELDGLQCESASAVYLGGGKAGIGKEKGVWCVTQVRNNVQTGPYTVLRVDFPEGFAIEHSHFMVKGRVLTPWNSIPEYAYSSIDYYTGFRSTVRYNWRFSSAMRRMKPKLLYTENEKGKKILAGFDGDVREIVLENGHLKDCDIRGIVWGKVYEKETGGVLGRQPSEVLQPEPLEEKGWRECDGFEAGKKMERACPERRSLLLLQEIESECAQDVLVEVGSGNGVQVFLNGECLAMHTSPRNIPYNKEVVLLPLKKGKNRLFVKLYNRFEKVLYFSLECSPRQQMYELALSPFELKAGNLHSCFVRLANPESPNSDMRLNNIKVVW